MPYKAREAMGRQASAWGLKRLEDAIVFEDDRLLALNKPSGVASHGGSGISFGAIETLRALRPGKTLELVRKLYPKAHFATVYAKPHGKPQVDTYVTEVSQDTWIFFPWDMALQYVQPFRGKD